MSLRNRFEKIGNIFFRYRSYIPIGATVIFLFGLSEFHYPVKNHSYDFFWEMICLTLSFLGLLIRVYTVGTTPKGTSGRNTKKQRADVLNTTGIYSVLRHPLYTGNFLIWLGVALFLRVWWVALIFIVFFISFYAMVAFAEEEFLRKKFGAQFENWVQKTPIFIPRLSSWQQPSLPFSLKTAVRKEYATFYAIIITYFLMELIGDYAVTHQSILDPAWGVIFAVSTTVYIVVRIITKKTDVLKVKNR